MGLANPIQPLESVLEGFQAKVFFKKQIEISLIYKIPKHQFFMNPCFQSPLKHFLEVEWSYPRCLEGPTTSRPCNALTFMVIQSLNPFLLKQTLATAFFSK